MKQNGETGMPRDYGAGAPLSYNRYLKVADLIALQECLSSPAHHDELLFITVHQAYELWFKQILHELDAAIAHMGADRIAAAARDVARVVEIEKLLVTQIHILETMTPLNFLGFRDELNPASGFQSMQFREIEFVSGLKDEKIMRAFQDDSMATDRLKARLSQVSLRDAFFALLARRGFDVSDGDASGGSGDGQAQYDRRVRAVVEVLTHPEKHHQEFQLAEQLIAHDEYCSLWRAHHVKMVERMVGAKRGTGGSEGIGYLKTTLEKKFFPELWEARTFLSTAGDGCPFA